MSKISGSGVSAAKQSTVQDKQKESRLKGEFLVQKGMTLSQIAKKFNISVDDLKKATGLKSSALTAGQVLKGLPTDTIRSGKGLDSLAKEHGMTLKDFCALNGINENYKPKAGERFFVYPNQVSSKKSTAETKSNEVPPKQNAETVKPQTSEKPAQNAVNLSAQSETPELTLPFWKSGQTLLDLSSQKEATALTLPFPQVQQTESVKKANKSEQSSKSTRDIAKALEKSSKNIAAIGRDEFKAAFSQVNKDNVAKVIKAYDVISPKESLIKMISSEWGNSKETRKAAITKLYDTLAQHVGKDIATKQKREAFMSEMDKEYGSAGFVSTTKMDKMINDLISEKQKADAKAKTLEDADLDKQIIPERSGNKTVITLGNKRTITSEELQYSADKSALKCNRTVARPEPVVDKNGNIVAGVKVYEASSDTQGPLSGKTIIVNPGHGGYRPSNGMFDPGTSSKNNKNVIVEEWVLNRKIANEIIPQLTAKGAKVILINGTATAVVEAKEKYKKADMFISIHCDSVPEKKDRRGQTIIYQDGEDKRLAEAVEAQLDTYTKLDKEMCKSAEDKRDLGVLREVSSMPSILIEAGFQSNAQDLSNLESKEFREEFSKHIVQGIIDYVNEK